MPGPYDLLVAPFAEFAFMRRALVASVALALHGTVAASPWSTT